MDPGHGRECTLGRSYGDNSSRRTSTDRIRLERRFWRHVVRDPDTECWEWTAARKNGGYGSFAIGRGNVYAHRFAYEMLVGPIPGGLELDHLCRNRGCANPDHLEPVTRQINVLRGRVPEQTRHRNLTNNPNPRARARAQ
jgi:hypothetical protein